MSGQLCVWQVQTTHSVLAVYQYQLQLQLVQYYYICHYITARDGMRYLPLGSPKLRGQENEVESRDKP